MRLTNLVGGSGQGVGVVPLAGPMAADHYRQRAFEAQKCAAQATEPCVKHGWQLLVHQWLALAEQVDRFERRYGSLVATGSEKWHVGRERLWNVIRRAILTP